MKVKVVQSVLKANDAVAAHNRQIFDSAGVLAINIMSAPGSGKTALLEKTIPALLPDYPSVVLVGDLQTSRDAERLGGLASDVVQINTVTGCHLTATQVADSLAQIDLKGISIVWIENVGNMVCPAGFDLGEHLRVVLLSVPEGPDKVAKYPTLFQPADAILLTKTDLIDVLEYDITLVKKDLLIINTRAPLMEISSKTGSGIENWLDWMRGKLRKKSTQKS